MREHYVSRVAEICEKLTAWKGDEFGGVNGNQLPDNFISKRGLADIYSSNNMIQFAEEFMDISSFYFYHCDLGPGDIIVDSAHGSIGIIDWATAGYVPKAWIRTRFGLCGGLNLESVEDSRRAEWRNRNEAKLREMGFPEAVQAMHFARYGEVKPAVGLNLNGN